MKDKIIDITTVTFFLALIVLAAVLTFKNPNQDIDNQALKTWFSPQISQPEDIENTNVFIEGEYERGRYR